MIATLINCLSVLAGSCIGLVLQKRVAQRYREIIYTGVGAFTLIIGIMMAIESERILFVALSIVIGGILGTWWNVEGGILRFGSFLERVFDKKRSEGKQRFAHGFLNASILFCVGAMTIVGAFRAGAEGQYDLLLTKSVMDGCVAILMAAAMGMGVAFSAITILVYQGGLTLLAAWLAPHINELVLSELSGTGGILILMIGLNLLDLKKIETGNFLPSLGLILVFTLLEPVVLRLIG